MVRRASIAADEWYHCFNRGVDKRTVFESEDDCNRFIALLYISNDEDTHSRLAELERRRIHVGTILDRNVVRGTPLVDIGAYALLPNHFHCVIRPLTDSGLSRFMQKVFTGYTMYFNNKYERTGPLFSGKYKSKHLDTDEYFKHAVQYVLFNPIELFEPQWKKGIGNLSLIEKKLRTYPFSSVQDFFGTRRAENVIVHDVAREYFERKPSLAAMLRDAQQYYQENAVFLER